MELVSNVHGTKKIRTHDGKPKGIYAQIKNL